MRSLEKKLSKIEQDLKKLKASYPTSGVNVKLYVSKQSFTVNVTGTTTIRIKFTPTYNSGSVIMANLTGKLDSLTRLTGMHGFWCAYQQIQSGNSEVVIGFPFTDYDNMTTSTSTAKISVVASATSPGTFTKL